MIKLPFSVSKHFCKIGAEDGAKVAGKVFRGVGEEAKLFTTPSSSTRDVFERGAGAVTKSAEAAAPKTAKQIAAELNDVGIIIARQRLFERMTKNTKAYFRAQECYKGLSEPDFNAVFKKHHAPNEKAIFERKNAHLDSLMSANKGKSSFMLDGVSQDSFKQVYSKEHLEYLKAYAKQKGYKLVLKDTTGGIVEVHLQKA